MPGKKKSSSKAAKKGTEAAAAPAPEKAGAQSTTAPLKSAMSSVDQKVASPEQSGAKKGKAGKKGKK